MPQILGQVERVCAAVGDNHIYNSVRDDLISNSVIDELISNSLIGDELTHHIKNISPSTSNDFLFTYEYLYLEPAFVF